MASERRLRAADIAVVVIGGIIGVGIFFTPAETAATVPSSGWVLGVWALGGLLAALGALVAAELGSRWPEAGGLFVFLRRGLPGRSGELAAAMYALVVLGVVTPASLAVVALVWVLNLEVLTGALPTLQRGLVAAALLAALAGLNAAGVRFGRAAQWLLTAAKLVAIGVLVMLGMAWGTEAPTAVAGEVQPGWLFTAMLPVMFSYGGFQHGTYVAGSALDPQRSVPRGIVLGIVVVVLAYLTVIAAYLALLGQAGMASAGALAAEAATVALGPAAGTAMAVAILLSAAGVLNAILFAVPWVLVALARDGRAPGAAGRVDAQRGSPVRAILAVGALSVLAVPFGLDGLGSLLAATSFGEWTFFALVAGVAWSWRREPAPFRVPPVVHLLFGLGATFVAVGAVWSAPGPSALAAVVMVVGALLLPRR